MRPTPTLICALLCLICARVEAQQFVLDAEIEVDQSMSNSDEAVGDFNSDQQLDELKDSRALQKEDLTIHDLSGSNVDNGVIEEGLDLLIDLRVATPGIYIMKVTDEDGKVSQHKLTVTR